MQILRAVWKAGIQVGGNVRDLVKEMDFLIGWDLALMTLKISLSKSLLLILSSRVKVQEPSFKK